MMWPDEGDYPQIQAFVAGPLGYLNFTPYAEAAGHVVKGMMPEGCLDTVRFQWSNELSGDDIYVPSNLVIPADVACYALFDFLDGGDRPSSTEWLEL